MHLRVFKVAQGKTKKSDSFIGFKFSFQFLTEIVLRKLLLKIRKNAKFLAFKGF